MFSIKICNYRFIKSFCFALLICIGVSNMSYAKIVENEVSGLKSTDCELELKNAAMTGTTYYVSSTGNNNYDGQSEASAWQTISKINTTNFSPGDSILFEGGKTFTGNIYLTDADGNDGNQPVTLRSYGTGKATINGNNSFGIFIYNSEGFHIENLIFSGSGMTTNSNTGIFLFSDLSGDVKLNNFEINNCEVSGFYTGITIGSSVGNSGYNNVEIKNSKIYSCLDSGINSYGFFSNSKVGYSHSNIIVNNCEVYDIPGFNNPDIHSGNGIVLGNVQNSVIEYCTVYNCGSGNIQCGGPIGIWFWDSDAVTIQYCEAYNISSGTGCDGGGFDLDGGVTNGIMQYNYSHDNDGSGFLVGQFPGSRPMENIIVRYNISENDAQDNGGSLTLFNNANDPMSNISCYNNTCYVKRSGSNVNSSGIHMFNLTPINDNISFYNNIIYADTGADLVYIPPGYSAEFLGNLYYSSTDTFNIKYQSVVYNSLAAFRSSGNETSGGVDFGVQADPMWNAFGEGTIIGFGGDLASLDSYKLSDNSPAINQGFNLNRADNMDFFGNTFNTTKRDIGAHQNQGTLSLNTDIKAPTFTIYPNPVESELSIKSANANIISITILDALGREVKKIENLNNKTISLDISQLLPSIYLTEIKTDVGVFSKRFIKK